MENLIDIVKNKKKLIEYLNFILLICNRIIWNQNH